ncbi:FUSC family protein [Mycetocola zhujimingii]|uniref:FUSC family protein n=1 Tax=Mycetocola zhujimingii TaxID=2079792 RepID=A0A2U1TD32_9MICO|nr:aromatic acid exporter family protein [Mycetocola zhujimingii]AWB85252.1 FUSC family protein [Mycetocola zhujimingii]PWC06805.1 FUSC family protein [Mycetocola zhujimingii]
MTSATRTPVQRAGARLKAWVSDPRFLLAVKTSIAVAIAWLIAPLVPGVAEEYPYYAPLGALISMYPTLMSSLRTSIETLASLAIGILLAAIVLIVAAPNVVTISLVIGAGVLIAGSKWLTTGGDYVPVAALFVLIVGGPNADSYSIGYIVQMSVGVAVGLLVNFLILPPLNFNGAVVKLAQFRSLLAKHLEEVGDALVENWPPEHEGWASRSNTLAETATAVRVAVGKADESRRGNPRARRHKRNLDDDYRDLADLERITFHVRDLTEVLAAAIWDAPFHSEVPERLREPLSEALHAVADPLKKRNSDRDVADAVEAARGAVDALTARIDQQTDSAPSALTPVAAVAMDLNRILAVMVQDGERA